MNLDFWHQKWQKNEIAFHEKNPNAFLVAYFKELNLPKGSRVFLPLCGKTLDIAWLLSQGYRVVGAELSQLAIEQLFIDLGVKPSIAESDKVLHYSAPNIDILVGDIFDVTKKVLGKVDAIYDRAALVALPEAMRKRYSQHLLNITDAADQLLVTFEYDQNLLDGPPFSLNSDEVHRHYKDAYQLKLLESTPVSGGLKGKCPASESVWLLAND